MADKRHHPDAGTVALQGLVEQLVLDESPRADAGGAPTSGTANARDALRAIARLARAIETPAQAGDLDPEEAHRMAALLLVVRDAIEPLGPDTPEPVRRFLAEVVDKLRR